MKSKRATEYLTTPRAQSEIKLMNYNLTSHTPKDFEDFLKQKADQYRICRLNLPSPQQCNEPNAVGCYVPRIVLITLLKGLISSGKIVPLTRGWNSSYGTIFFKLICEDGD